MNKPTQEQIKEFWEWCAPGLKHEWDNEIAGYKISEAYCTRCHASDWPPSNSQCYPPLDLNNLFKWAVPKLLDMNCTIDILTGKGDTFVKVDAGLFELGVHKERNPDPALALFWAIWQVIKGGKE